MMEVFENIISLRVLLGEKRKLGMSIGLVPTMGALHEGHLKLIEASKSENDITICSIFVNPIQFNNASDLEKYPKNLENDKIALESANCDILFFPSTGEIYPFKPSLTIEFGYQNEILEGKLRPGHFSGVGIVVSKLFNIVQPGRAYFGQKDFQQCLVIQQLVNELSFPVEIKIVQTIREYDGLAMSSRNRRLSVKERNIAPKIFHALQFAEIQSKLNVSITKIASEVKEMLYKTDIKMEYLDILDYKSGQVVENMNSGNTYIICIAAFIGEVRLIDNLILKM